MTATADVKTVVETLSGKTKTGTQLTNIGDAFAKAALTNDRIIIRLQPLHFDVDGIPIDFATLTSEQKAEIVIAALKNCGKEVIYAQKYREELDTAEDTVETTAESAAADFT